MLENIDDLNECEKIINSLIDDIKFLGEVDFSYEDIERLSRLIRDRINEGEENGIKFLRRIPACVSLYLVGKGIVNYCDGEFWPSVIEELGLIDDRNQYDLGAIFLKYIQSHGLVDTHIEGALAYVTPILLHGGIPRSCFREFYEKIVKYLLDRKIIEDHEVRKEINRIRTIENERNELLNHKNSLFNQINILRQKVERLEEFISLSQKREVLLEAVADHEKWIDLLEYDWFIAAKELQQFTLKQVAADLSKRQSEYLENIASFTPYDQKLLNYCDEISILSQDSDDFRDAEQRIRELQAIISKHEAELVALATSIWQGKTGLPLGGKSYCNGEQTEIENEESNKAPIARLISAYYQRVKKEECQEVVSILQTLLACKLAELSTSSSIPRDVDTFVTLIREQKTLDPVIADGKAWVAHIKEIQAFNTECQQCEQELVKLNEGIAEWEAALEQAATALPAPVICPPEQKIEELTKCLKQAESRKNEADAAREAYQKEVLPALRANDSRRLRIEQEIAAVEQRLSSLGKGCLAEGVRILQQKKQAQEELKRIEHELERNISPQGPKYEHELGQEFNQEIDCIDGYLNALPWRLETREKLRQKIEDLKGCLELIKQRARLVEITADPADWADLPDYYSFIAAKRAEIKENEQETVIKEEKAAECLKQIASYAPNDHQLIGLAVNISKVAQDLSLYQEKRNHRELLRAKSEICARKIDSLASEFWRALMPLKDGARGPIDPTSAPGGAISSGDGMDAAQSPGAGVATEGILSSADSGEGDLKELMIGLASLDELELNEWMENLNKLQAVHYEYKATVRELSEFECVVAKWKATLQQITEDLSLPITGTLNEITTGLAEQMRLAEERKNVAEAAKKHLTDRVVQGPNHAKDCLTRVRQEIDSVDRRICELGKGDLEVGKEVLFEKKSAFLELEKIEQQLGQYAGELIETQENIQGAISLKEEKSKELNIAQANRFRLEEQLDDYSHPFDYADEPVQRFVIYGGEWAIKWLAACTALHRSYLGEAIDLEPIAAGLPARVFGDLDQLMKNVIDEREVNVQKGGPGLKPELTSEGPGEKGPPQEKTANRERALKEHWSCPQVMLDIEQSELKMVIGGHRFHIYDNTSTPTIHAQIVSGEMPPAWTAEVPMHGYLNNGMVEIPEERLDIPYISNEYLITQYIGNKTLTWRVKLWDDAPCLIFSEKGQKIEPSQLAAQRAWLLFPEDHELFPGNAIVSASDVTLDMNRYRMALVNLVLEPVISLVDNNGQIYEITSLCAIAPSDPFLSKEEMAVGAWVDGKRPIYIGAIPKLCMPSNDEKEMSDWSIRIIKKLARATEDSIITGCEIPLSDYSFDNKYIEINLNSEALLGHDLFGEYSVIFSRQHKDERRFDLAIFPDLMLFFESDLYFPLTSEGKEAVLTIVRPEHIGHNLQVEVEKPARIIADDNDEIHIAVDLDLDELQIKLYYSSESGQFCTPITVEIPKIAWRVRGSKTSELEQWSHHVQEIWHEDCYGLGTLQLEVALPSTSRYAPERSTIYLKGTNHKLATKAKGRLLTFDLSGLADTLRGEREIYSLWLVIEDAMGKSRVTGNLFDIRREWRVEQIRYAWDDGKQILSLCWVDRGRAHDRVALLWRLWEPWVDPWSITIPDGASDLKIPRSITELPPGPYLLKFDVSDQWSDEHRQLVLPREKINTGSLFIPCTGTHVEVSECCWLDEKTLQINGSVPDATGPKEIVISLYGVIDGVYKTLSLETVTDHEGQFSLKFNKPYAQTSLTSNRVRDRKKIVTRPHWLGVTVKGGGPVYHYQILPEPGLLMWPLSLGADLIEKELAAEGRIYIDCQDVNLDVPFIRQELVQSILQGCRQGHEIEQNICISVGGTDKTARLLKDRQSDDVSIELQTEAVKCLDLNCPYGYGTIEPDQQAWNTKHGSVLMIRGYPPCHTFRYNFRKINATLHWCLDVKKLLADLREKYSLAGLNLLLLYDSSIRPLPDGVGSDTTGYDEADLEILIRELWKQEMILLGEGMR